MATKTDFYIQEWLLLGSFPEKDPKKIIAEKQFAPKDIEPKAGSRTAGKVWQRYVSPNPVVDLLGPAIQSPIRTNCSAYAFTYLFSSRACTAKLLVGSDDGCAVWVNGECVYELDGQRQLVLDSDIVPIHLQQGKNRLLIKISQLAGDWGFSVRLLAPKGIEVIPTLEVPSAGLSVIRQPEISYLLDRGVVELWIPLYNSGPTSAENIVLHLGSRTRRLGEIKPGELRTVFFRFEAEELWNCLSNKGTWISSDSSPKRIQLTGLSSRVFLDVMTGGALPLDDGAKIPPLQVPQTMQEQPVLIRIDPALDVTRDPVWPQWPSVRFERAGETICADLAAPPGYKAIARVIYGGPRAEKMASKLLLYSESIDIESRTIDRIAQEGLAGLAAADFDRALEAAEKLLEAVEAKIPASRDIAHLVGHAHIDMNWLWRLPETIQCCQDTFRQVIAFLDEFPEFKFSQSQASTYHLIEEFDPGLYEKIKAAVASGRWEILGGMIDEGDTNLSSGEGIVRSLLLGQLYFREKFGKIARVGWLPDNFGHIASLPQLLQLSGMEFFYFHRCSPFKGLFWWEAPGGMRVLAYSNDTYNEVVDPSICTEADRFNKKYRRTMVVYGVGDHGGGPTRRDIQNALLYTEAKNYPQIKFSTAEEFFRAALADGADYPVHKGEMQYVFEGCYTTVSEIKRLNRACENALFGAELLASLVSQSNPIEARRILGPAWQTVTFNQFHDILCGSAIHESHRDAIVEYASALATAERLRTASLRRLADSIITDGPGQPVVVFNPLPQNRTDLVEAEVFSHISPPHIQLPSWGDFDARGVTAADASVKLTDHQGRTVPCQVVGGKLFPNGYRVRVLFGASDVPACGYRTYYCSVLEHGPESQNIVVKGTKIETDLLSLTVDPRTGRITKLYDKRLKRNILKRSGGNALRVYMERPHPMSAWNIGPISTVYELDQAERVTIIEKGPVRAGIEVEYRFNRSKLIQRIYLCAGMPRVDFELEAHWFEQGDATTDAPMLRVEFPLMLNKGNFVCDTPFCVVERPRDGREVPAQKWVDLSNGQWGAALLSDSKYGYSCTKSVLRMTLLRSSYDPDRYPDQGLHHFRYALLPHEGDWRFGVMKEGLGFNLPLLGIETASRKDGQSPVGSFLLLEPENVFLSAVKPPEQGDGLIVRFWEAEGKTTTARLRFARPVRSAIRVDLLEDPLANVAQPGVNGNTVTVETQPHEVVSLKLKF
ncbi:hypothetical protein DRQ00_03725 [candidate division KSB1 bacterium]|nr:MAG: hypothetical protein DRQ00_03725 [candidate division KSB1 bacterium]